MLNKTSSYMFIHIVTDSCPSSNCKWHSSGFHLHGYKYNFKSAILLNRFPNVQTVETSVKTGMG